MCHYSSHYLLDLIPLSMYVCTYVCMMIAKTRTAIGPGSIRSGRFEMIQELRLIRSSPENQMKLYCRSTCLGILRHVSRFHREPGQPEKYNPHFPSLQV